MSVLFETDLTEYARQCTLERRRYEECVQEAQQNGMNQSTAASACAVASPPAEKLAENCQLDQGTNQAKQVSLADLLELSVDPSTWDDKQSFDEASNGVTEAHQWHRDRSQSTQQHVAHSTRSNANPVSYGAP